MAFPYVKLAERLHNGIIADMETGWSLAGKDVVSTANLNAETIRFIDSQIARGNIVQATEVEFSNVDAPGIPVPTDLDVALSRKLPEIQEDILGSADSLDDWYDGIDQEAAWYQPDVTGNYVSTPDHASLDVVDLTVMWYGALDDATINSVTQALISRWDAGTSRTWLFGIFGISATLIFQYSTNGVNSGTKLSLPLSPNYIVDGASQWIAVTFDANDGNGNNVARAFVCDTVPPSRIPNTEEWIQVGVDTDAGTVALHNSTLPVEVGSGQSGTVNRAKGKHARAIICSDIGPNGVPGSTIVAEYNANIARGSRYRDVTGKVWTHTGAEWSVTGR